MDTKDILLHKQIKTFLSLGGLFFFGPYISYLLKNSSFNLNDDEKKFVLSFAKIGYLSILLALIVIVTGAFSFFSSGGLFALIYTISTYTLVAILLVGSVFVFADTQLLQQGDNKDINVESIDVNQKNIVSSFIPGYNFYLRYHIHQFSHPYWYLKESLLWTVFFVLAQLLLHSNIISLAILLLMILRIITLLAGYDLVPRARKEKINMSFLVNIEEMWADLLGASHYIWEHYIRKHPEKSMIEYITMYRASYIKLHSFNNNPTLILAYGLLIIVVALYVRYVGLRNLFGLELGLETLLILLVSLRYLVMIPYKQFPLIPILHEISTFIVKLIRPYQ